MRRIGVFTGSRANYSSTKTIIRGLANDPDVEVVSIVGGAATLKRYGQVDKLMVLDGLPKPSFKFNMFIDGEGHADMAKSCGLGLMEMSTILDNAALDGLVVVGDRYDVMAPAVAAAYMNIPLIHTMGGEVTGTIDESIRHAITKFANIHLVANDDARQRVVKMGERARDVYTVGCPRLDLVKEAVARDTLTNEEFKSKYPGVGAEIDIENEFLLCSFHPVTTAADDLRDQVDKLMEALSAISMPTIMLWPNFDAGGNDVAKSIRTFREKYSPSWLNLQTNFSVEDYSRLMNRTKCLVGNSSSGIREGAFLGTPVVNIGSRQERRLRGKNVLDVKATVSEIKSGIEAQCRIGKRTGSDLYGDGNTGERITNILKTFTVQNTQKTIAY